MPLVQEMEPVRTVEDLKEGILVPEEDFERWLERHDWTWHQLARGEFPAPYASLDEFQLRCITSDPYLFCRAFLREPTDPDHKDPFNFFDYQLESLRFRGNTIHQCGAEVGKSREILAKSMYYAYTTMGGSGLIGAPLQVHLDEIVEMWEDQWSWNPKILAGRNVRKHQKKPHHKIILSNGFKLDFRPSGHDGAAYRGVHAATFAFKDEAAKDKNEKTWSEFWRAMKPGCVAGIYSVPDGDRSCEYYRLCQRAEGKGDEADGTTGVAANLTFRKFKWPKTLMPPPFWTPERRRHFFDVYGGEDSPGYQHNVLGEHGDPESSVFPTHQLNACVKEIPEYRCLKISVDQKHDEVSIYGFKYGVTAGDDGPVPQETVLLDDIRSARGFFEQDEDGDSDFKRMIRGFFVATPGLLFGGADLGFSSDPTEIRVKLILGRQERLVARLRLQSVTYDQQCQAIDALDDLYDGGRLEMRWGTDFGNAGSAVAHDLQGLAIYRHKAYDQRLYGYMFGATADNVDEDGEEIIDAKTGKPARITLKELATDLMVKKMQRRELEYPPDPDILIEYPNHTVRQGQGRRIYKGEDDHQIDADRVAILCRVLETAAADFFE